MYAQLIERLESRRLFDGTTESVAVGDILFTAVRSGAYDGGSDLYRSDLDGSNRILLKHWVSGDYGPTNLFGFHGQLFFAANWPEYGGGQEPWKSDGTPEGTVQVRDIYGGSQGSFPHDFMIVNDHLLFLARSTSLYQSVFVTDGTAAGTIYLLSPYYAYGGATNLIIQNDRLYAEVSSPIQFERWQTDGTVAGTGIADPMGILYPDHTLRVYSTNVADTIRMTAGSGRTRLTINSVTQTFRTRDCAGIEVHGLQGNDSIVLDDSIRTPVTLIGDRGADYLRGGGGNDHLYGGRPWESGDGDTVDGGAGDDFIEMSENSLAIGGEGDDRFDGHIAYGPQTVQGGAGDDGLVNTDIRTTYDGGPGFDSLDVSDKGVGIAGGGGTFHFAWPGSTDNFSYLNLERLIATDSADRFTLADNDSLRIIDGLRGNDTMTGAARAVTLIGGEGDDALTGGAADDLLIGGDGINVLDGKAGQDTIIGAVEGDDSIITDSRDIVSDSLVRVIQDYLYIVGSWRGDSIALREGPGNTGQVRITLNGIAVKLNASQVSGINGVTLAGGAGADRISVGLDVTLDTTLRGNGGDDTITPGGGIDSIDSGEGDDVLDYWSYTAPLSSSNYYEPQTISGQGGTDSYRDVESLLCGSGDDEISTYSGRTLRFIDGGAGNDRIVFRYEVTNPSPTVRGGEGDDRILIARPNSNTFVRASYFGDGGNDTLVVDQGSDVARDLHGGPDIDAVAYYFYSAVRVTLDDQPDDGYSSSSHDNVHTDIEVVIGTYGADTIIGSDHDETLVGAGGGPDLLIGGGGNDWIEDHPSYEGRNTLDGGVGRDTLLGVYGDDSQPDVFVSDIDDVVVKAGIMQITGTPGDDVIHIGPKPGDPQIVRATVNSQVYEVPFVFPPNPARFTVSVAKGLSGFNINRNGGEDSITVDPAITLPVTIVGKRRGDLRIAEALNDLLGEMN